jgi:putative transposase
VSFVDAHRERFGVEPICQTLEIAPSTYYSARCRPPSQRSIDDAVLSDEILRVWKENYQVYGARKVWLQLNREGVACGRDRVERLMKYLVIGGARRGKKTKTTLRDAATSSSLPDLVHRTFVAKRPNQLWVADLTYVATYVGFTYVAFVIDAYSRRIVGWAVASHLRTELALAALDMAIFLGTSGWASSCTTPTAAAWSVHLDPLHRAPRRVRRSTLGGVPRGLLRLRWRRRPLASTRPS